MTTNRLEPSTLFSGSNILSTTSGASPALILDVEGVVVGSGASEGVNFGGGTSEGIGVGVDASEGIGVGGGVCNLKTVA